MLIVEFFPFERKIGFFILNAREGTWKVADIKGTQVGSIKKGILFFEYLVGWDGGKMVYEMVGKQNSFFKSFCGKF